MTSSETSLPKPPDHPSNLAVLGSDPVTVPTLRTLVEAGYRVSLVVTGQDRRRSRRGAPTPNVVKVAAGDLGIAVTHVLDDVVGVGIDLGVVVAFGQLIPASILARVPMVNLHFSALPRWRGAAPVERALLAGDAEVEVDLMAVDLGLDVGGVYRREAMVVPARATAASLRAELAERGAHLLVRALGEGLRDAVPQFGPATYAAKLSTEELRLDWNRSADELDRVVRVGGAWTMVGSRRLKVLVATPDDGAEPAPEPGLQPGSLVGDGVVCGGGGVLRLERVQVEGRPPVGVDEFVRGARLGDHPVVGP